MKLQNPIHTLCLILGLAIAPSTSHALLLGLSPELPTIDFSGSGMIDYNASTGIINISGDPSTLFSVEPFIFAELQGVVGVDNIKNIKLKFQVDNSGNLIPSDISLPDLVIIGSIDMNGNGTTDHSGTLLTANVMQFGFLNGMSNGDDVFDLRLNSINGALAYLYSEQDLAARVISEVSTVYSNPFDNSFNADWQGQAKGVIGSTAPTAGGTLSTPIPPAFWLWTGAIALILPSVRRNKNFNRQS
ncbi:MAG: hypothetical protein DRQ62_09160 [Gammaproteobacteria bacterium]|nr:MAG: hypothetical protein DRQ62_09160 [Gammaproteobacteria bacterium]